MTIVYDIDKMILSSIITPLGKQMLNGGSELEPKFVCPFYQSDFNSLLSK